jgi:hypothetical protein
VDLREEAVLAALLVRVITHPDSAARLRSRPDWCEAVEQRLIQLHYAQPSVVWYLRDYVHQLGASQSDTLQPVLQIPTITQTELHRGAGPSVIQMPIEAGEVGVAITWDRSTSEEEFMLKAHELFREGRSALEEMHAEARGRALERERAHAREVRTAAAEGGPETEHFAALAEASEERVRQLQRPETRRRVRLGDRLARDMWFLRTFLQYGATTTAIAAEWADILVRWASGEVARDPVDLHALAEWKGVGGGDEPGIDSSLVGRRLRVWLGKRLGPNQLVRPDPTAPNGFRRFCPLDRRLERQEPIKGPSMCHGLSGRAHEIFHERQVGRGK